MLSYIIRNEGTEPASVLINLSMDKEDLKAVPFADHFVVIPPKETMAAEVKLTAGIKTASE